ncbi:MAG: hypothetical protein HY840_12920 [Bacteroidetes bacterium]|nr:hypothetical protein [Bacteroidota bacterium]
MKLKNVFGTKAETLEVLSDNAKSFRVLPLYKFTWQEWESNPTAILNAIKKSIKSSSLIIRSSALSEDTLHLSNAGKYSSIGNISAESDSEISNAIEKVFNSYENIIPQDQVFVQEHLSGICYAGVAFTADADTLAPYYIINYNEGSDSAIVTSGHNGHLKTYIQYKDSPVKAPLLFLQKLIIALKEIEFFFASSFLDVEFAVNKKEEIFIFQVRPIVKAGKENYSELAYQNALLGVFKKIKKLSSPHPNLLGDKTLFGVMPDWNPAEIIGIKPKQLAVSLYKEIVTDNIWAYQRDNYGYRNLRSHPLMIMFLGVPYIDVRVDFNSFIPKQLNERIAEKLVNYYLDKLTHSPALHDKVEFEIVHSCYYFNLSDKLQDLKKHGFSVQEITLIKKSLIELTNNIINPKFGHYKKDVEKIKLLSAKYDQVFSSHLSLVDKIYWLIEDCKRYGTLPFAGIARSAFIATQFLRSLIDVGIISKEDYQSFNYSLNTITQKLTEDLGKLKQGNILKKDFLEKYGHLRPGTYDIMSLRYDEDFKNYFSSELGASGKDAFDFSKKQINAIGKLIKQNGLKLSVQEMLAFIKSAIENREYAKFVFTKSLSKVLSLIEEMGKKNGIIKADMAFVDVKVIQGFYASLDNRLVKEVLESDIKINKEKYSYTIAAKLPHLISRAEDVYSFFLSTDEPNFITLKSASGEVLVENKFSKSSFENKIVFIRSADPGYDFLFARNIAGLVTQYGGANSHMSIRCSELGIPAVIGCGEQNFLNWSAAKQIELDCSNRTVRMIS